MDFGQTVEHIASSEALRLRPAKDEEELDEMDLSDFDGKKKLPAIRVDRDASKKGRFVVSGMGDRAPNHDNAGRLPFLVDWLNRRAMPLVDPESDPTGMYRIELHDSYSYLEDSDLYRNCISFGRSANSPRSIALFPDPYHMSDFGGAVSTASTDAVPWNEKSPKMFFAGTTTGNRDPTLNSRIKACVWAINKRDVAEMYITKVAQMTYQSVVGAYPEFSSATHAPFSVEDHFGYRYLVNICGNTACWNRLPMIMSTGSLVINARSHEAGGSDSTWYSPLIREGQHYVGADSANGPDLLKAHAFARSYDRQCRSMVHNANSLSRELFRSSTAATYASTLFSTVNKD
jgi:hypothetical protein